MGDRQVQTNHPKSPLHDVVAAVDQGVGEGVAQKGWGWGGFGVGQELQECWRFINLTSSNFNAEDNKAASPIPEEFGARLCEGKFCLRSR